MGADSPALPTSTSYSRLDPSGHDLPYRPRRSPSNLAWTAALRRPAVFLPTLAFCLVVALTLHRTGISDGSAPSATSVSEASLRSTLHDSLDRIPDWRSGVEGTGRPRSEDDAEWLCNPFDQNGRLSVHLDDPTQNVWTPFDSRCPPSNLMASLYRPPGDTSRLIPPESTDRSFLPWFQNRTVVLHGDSIDRFHLQDFCEFVGGRLELLTPDHPACPPMWKMPGGDHARRDKERVWEERPREGWELTNPWVCDVEEYGATLVNVFTWGLEGAEAFFETERWYYPPATWIDRLDHITLPLLPLLAKHLNRPQIAHPDLVILNSGFWDLRKYTEEDFVSSGFPTRPYPEDSPIPYTNLSPAREQTWEREARKAIKHAAQSFRGKEGNARDGPVLVWRSLHHPPRHNYAPFPRVFALDSLARKVVSDLRLSSPSSRAPSAPLSPLAEQREAEDLNLAARLRIDESGRLMLGQEHLFRDLLHPLPVPGSWLWGNVMLYE
ncbi:SPOSA6832_04288 [Sporobolomyces salmonicolor]|uniref:SPOSA6832_04288-mRNA-1:cds n=1 Tax=Sporidiobolus salmonicolor TaxID=5005 RepID=A0A0D6ERR4_SPOSA|nr:SPOSA6832_04288 [Sporobolomyces salmonicolor]